ncbi:uncharacterized protein DUF3967 [Aneurinibacillus soli]|uniref:Uncharacterized protein n=1 Tax=Aneurinibacillus soli TaxID=1500254 RepID=A0A0U5BF50_9BACL|nr:DUF3967 domain-containing protein [Aneurinibacillus soli]PYE58628.1 uncharacterized protein DUF3967 [Aneurinibacillus soli]BAU29612.1 hypothetical protein CB4_03823 [Aneurinibacillus soli]
MNAESSGSSKQEEDGLERSVRERDERITQMIREKQETRILLASMEQPSFWRRLFRRT